MVSNTFCVCLSLFFFFSCVYMYVFVSVSMPVFLYVCIGDKCSQGKKKTLSSAFLYYGPLKMTFSGFCGPGVNFHKKTEMSSNLD